MSSLYLASASPRRRGLLTQISMLLSMLATTIDESPLPNEVPAAYVERLAHGKVVAGLAMLERCDEDSCVLGADTSVVIDGRILGKSVDQADRPATLAALFGCEHQILTAMTLAAAGGVEARVVECRVRFHQAAPEGVLRYWQNDESADKTGGYAIQGLGAISVSCIKGGYNVAVGLSLCKTAEPLRKFDIPCWQLVGGNPLQRLTRRNKSSGRMNKGILINIAPMESCVAVAKNGVLQEIHVKRTQRCGIIDDICKGWVVRVLPGMQVAFVDIGLEHVVFTHATEVSNHEGSAVENISALTHEGQALVVQVTKDPVGTEDARLIIRLSIPSRYPVYAPRTNHVEISLRTKGEVERERLKRVVADCMVAKGIERQSSFILHTTVEDAGKDEILTDIRYLRRLQDQTAAQTQAVGAPSVIYEDLSLATRTLYGLVNLRIEKIRINSREDFQKITSFVEELMSEISGRLEHYPDERPIFDLYGAEDEIQKASERKILLESDGYPIVNPTEVMTIINVSTDVFVGHHDLEETVLKTNLEATITIARQLRLCNLDGITIIGFIDVEDGERRRQVLRILEKQLERDHAKTDIIGITELGLVQMTRERVRRSLVQILCEPCPYCQRCGTLKTTETTCYEISREVPHEACAHQADFYPMLVNQEITDRLLGEEPGNATDLEAFIGRTIKFQVEAMYSQE